VTFPLKPDAQGNAQEKRVRGAYEFREYQVKKSQQDDAFDNMMRELPQAGFRIKFSSKPSIITARKEDIWVLVNFSGESYNVSLVKGPPEVWAFAKTAAEISREMQAHNRVDIYGIQFSSDDQSILEQESPILFETLKYLEQNNDISVIVESDKMTPNRPAEVDSEICRERANSVVDWLIAHGIARSRVQPRAAGRNNPITENESPSEIQRNERIVLVKISSA
jgi:outer membrane protein OmpA-like peptidoglycan-associated protein